MTTAVRLFLLVTLAAAFTAAEADTLNVPSKDYPTIASALSAAWAVAVPASTAAAASGYTTIDPNLDIPTSNHPSCARCEGHHDVCDHESAARETTDNDTWQPPRGLRT